MDVSAGDTDAAPAFKQSISDAVRVATPSDLDAASPRDSQLSDAPGGEQHTVLDLDGAGGDDVNNDSDDEESSSVEGNANRQRKSLASLAFQQATENKEFMDRGARECEHLSHVKEEWEHFLATRSDFMQEFEGFRLKQFTACLQGKKTVHRAAGKLLRGLDSKRADAAEARLLVGGLKEGLRSAGGSGDEASGAATEDDSLLKTLGKSAILEAAWSKQHAAVAPGEFSGRPYAVRLVSGAPSLLPHCARARRVKELHNTIAQSTHPGLKPSALNPQHDRHSLVTATAAGGGGGGGGGVTATPAPIVLPSLSAGPQKHRAGAGGGGALAGSGCAAQEPQLPALRTAPKLAVWERQARASHRTQAPQKPVAARMMVVTGAVDYGKLLGEQREMTERSDSSFHNYEKLLASYHAIQYGIQRRLSAIIKTDLGVRSEETGG